MSEAAQLPQKRVLFKDPVGLVEAESVRRALKTNFIGTVVRIGTRSGELSGAIAIGLTLLVGSADFVSGKGISWSGAFIGPIAFGTWFVGRRFGYALGALSITLWFLSDVSRGQMPPSWIILVYNIAIKMALYYAFVRVLSYGKDVTDNLESKVAARTAELRILERELIEVGAREQRRIGSDLHDGLGQHLAATALAAQVLKRELVSRSAPEVARADAVVGMIDRSMGLARNLAKGLQPIDMQSGGLMIALSDFAANISEMFQTRCELHCSAPVVVTDVACAEQLYRITQEATTNAIKHGQASQVIIRLEDEDDGIHLSISDNGRGFLVRGADQRGMGLRIMNQRASLIGARIAIRSEMGKETVVSCLAPAADEVDLG